MAAPILWFAVAQLKRRIEQANIITNFFIVRHLIFRFVPYHLIHDINLAPSDDTAHLYQVPP